MENVLYLYGFVPKGAGEGPAVASTGIAERPVETVDLGFCEAVVSRVPAAEYAAGAVESRLRDLEWVGAQGLAHERVVTRYVDEAWILPARLLTLYSSRSTLEAEAESRADQLGEALERLRDTYEWDLKVTYDTRRLEARLGELSEEVADLEERIGAATPGTGYLLGRVKSRKVEGEAAAAARRTARALLDELAGGAEEVVEIELPREDTGHPVALNAALLVRSGGEERMTAVVDDRRTELAEHGIRVDFSGPWAPYRFLGDRREPAGAGGGPGVGSRT